MAELKDDIEKYLRGQMSPAEMHALEKKALSDPFLSEALDGATTLNTIDFLTDVIEVKHRVGDRLQSRNRWKIPLRIAASIALLAVASYVIVHFALPDNSSGNLALKKPTENKSGSPKQDSLSTPVKPNAKLKAVQSPTSTTPATRQPDAVITPTISASPRPVEPGVAEGAGNIASLSVEKKSEPIVSDHREVEAEKLAGRLDGVATRIDLDAGALEGRVISGKITDAVSGAPISGASVKAEGTAQEVVSDNNGLFKMVVDVRPDRLAFSSTGFETKVVKITATQSVVDVQLPTESTQLTEVAVVSIDRIANDTLSDKPVVQAQPLGGRSEYNVYLEKNLRYPERAKKQNVQGNVTVEFVVEPDGSLSNFTIVRGLTTACNKEVIRLVKAGPGWTPSTQGGVPVKTTLLVRVTFELSR